MKTKLTPEDRNYIIELREQGISLNDIVRKIRGKVSPQRVDAIYKNHLLKSLQITQ